MIVGIVGSRRRNTEEDFILVLTSFLETLGEKEISKNDVVIVSGGCPSGGDRFAEVIAEQLNVKIKIFHADWKQFGRSAGFMRNTDIASESEILITCIAKDRTGGTEDTIRKFEKIHKPNKAILV